LEAAHERAERLKIEKARDAWRITGLVFGSITAAGIVVGILTIILK